MKQVQRLGKSIKYDVAMVLETLASDLNDHNELEPGEVCSRWVVESAKIENGYFWIKDTEEDHNHAVEIFTDGNDLFGFCWFHYDGWDNMWTGTSRKGQSFEIVNGVPVVVSY